MSRQCDRSELLEVADIFRQFGTAYLQTGIPVSSEQRGAARAICNCRTAVLGGHIDKCDQCGVERISYNSCRNRHCPKCQFKKREEWLQNREKELLPIPYFHIVFTLPSELNSVIRQNRREMYELLFRCVSQTLLQAAGRFLQADIGIICMLHTWGQTLTEHPHIHCIVTGGGLSDDQRHWRPARDSFFVPVRVLSRLFRGKFLAHFKQMNHAAALSLTGQCLPLRNPDTFRTFMGSLYEKEWVVYAKAPFARPQNLLRYIGHYTHRVAISNRRILDVDETHVSFQYKDYSDNNTRKAMTVTGQEFIRRFLLHILPARFVKIRYYGLFANRRRRKMIALCRSILQITASALPNLEDHDPMTRVPEREDLYPCEICLIGAMLRFRLLRPTARSP